MEAGLYAEVALGTLESLPICLAAVSLEIPLRIPVSRPTSQKRGYTRQETKQNSARQVGSINCSSCTAVSSRGIAIHTF